MNEGAAPSSGGRTRVHVASLALLLAFAIVLLLAGTASASSVWYVDDDAAAGGDGLSWATAFTDLQSALTAALSGDQIWVAAGTYKPDGASPGDRTLSFTLRNGVALYGGFAGGETALEERDWGANPTILSGNIGAAGNSDNSHHVVVGVTGATLDGFTVTAGNANGSPPYYYGGGMYNDAASPTISNCAFSGNSAQYSGGGMYNIGSSPILTECSFSGNSMSYSAGEGGGMYNYLSSPTLTGCTFSGNSSGGLRNYQSSPILTECSFSGNTSSSGAAVSNNSSDPVLSDCTFTANISTYSGGAFYNLESSPTLSNCIFSKNTASYYGGGFHNDSYSDPIIINCTFSGNSAGNSGGALYNREHCDPILTNCILWGDGVGEIANIDGSLPVVTYSLVQGGYTGTGNLGGVPEDDPLFVDAANGDLHLQAGSPAIDAGTATGAPAFDLDGTARPQDGDGDGTAECDLGAYEREEPPPVRLFVDDDATGADDGTSWTDAFTDLQSALSAAASGDEIWVAAGTYKPDGASPGDRTLSFTLKNGVALYGGLAGTEAALEERDWSANATVLSGDIGTVGDAADNSYQVLVGVSNATLDGFTVTKGNANGGWPRTVGGGMYNSSAVGLVVTNVIFTNNTASWYGGGVYNGGGSPSFTNVTFSGNSAGSWGGGMAGEGDSTTLTNVTFLHNSAVLGGGVFGTWSSLVLTNATFNGNSASDTGGAIYITHSGAILKNCILWGDTSPEIIYPNDGSGCQANYSIVAGGWSGEGNLDVDPLFVDAAAGDLRLRTGSPAIDTGTNTGAPAMDLDGRPRPWDGDDDGTPIVDMGAFERAPDFVDGSAAGANNGTTWADAFTDLQSALDSAGEGDEIWVAAGTYLPDGAAPGDRTLSFVLKSGVAIYGGFAGTERGREQRDWTANPTILSGDIGAAGNAADNSYHVVVGVTGGVIDGFTVTGGNADGNFEHAYGGGMHNTGQAPVVANVIFSGNFGTSGGGIGNYQSSPTLTDVTFSGNSATNGGGMGNDYHCAPTLSDVTFSDNSATRGGGMYTFQSSPTLSHVTFSGNTALEGGGAYNYQCSPTFIDVTFDDNSAANYGGGMHNQYYGSPTLSAVTFTNNSASWDGGAISNYNNCYPELTDCAFSGNWAPYGGGIRNADHSSPALTGVTFSGNSASDRGGGIYNHLSSPTLTDVTFSGNSAFNGGGMYSEYNSSPSLDTVTFDDNRADAGGGMFFRDHCAPSIQNVTFTGNVGTSYGGGLHLGEESAGTLTNVVFDRNVGYRGGGLHSHLSSPALTNASFSGNVAAGSWSDPRGGAIFIVGGGPTLQNCVLWGDTGPTDPEISVDPGAGFSGSIDYSIVQGGWTGAGSNNLGAAPEDDPLFVDPANGDLHLQADSPAIDAGTATGAPAFDLDGVARPQDGDGDAAADFDMGAYEYEYVAPSTVDVSLAAGWNLVAGGPGTDFGSAIFGWNGSAYFSPPAVEAWQGYWCKATTATTVDMHPVAGPHTITLTTGWNLIGNPMAVAAAVAVYDAGDVLIPGRSLFVYTPGSGYATTPTLAPGQGAWVKGTAGETVVLTPTG